MKHRDERNRRTGERKPRGSYTPKRTYELGYYCVVTDTKETEKNYLYGLRESLPNDTQNKLNIQVVSTDTKDLFEEASRLKNLNPQYSQTWIVFDHDRVTAFDAIIEQACADDIKVGWSNPCIEIWFHAYYGKMPVFQGGRAYSKECWSSFKKTYKQKTGQEYEKADSKIYRRLKMTGDEATAILLAKQRYKANNDGEKKPSEMDSTTTLFMLIEDILSKVSTT